jgi:putative ABC transport system permease protein
VVGVGHQLLTQHGRGDGLSAAGKVLDLDVRAGDLAGLTGATIAVGSDLARSRDARVGRQVTLILGDGARVSARVVATYDRNLGFGSVVLSKDLAAGHTSTGLDASVLIRTAPGPDAERALAAFAASRPGLSLTGTVAEPGGVSTASAETWINLATIAVLLGYLLLSIANKLVATTAQRRTEIAALRLIGTTPRQILAMMRREAALISVAALAAGLALSAAPLALVGLGFLDRPWPAGPIWLLPATAGTVIAIAFLTIELPTRQALRTAPADALARQG